MNGHHVTHRDVVEESDTIDATTNDFSAFIAEEQLASHEFQSVARDGDQVTAECQYSTPADPTLVEHIERDIRSTGAQQAEPRVDGKDMEVVLCDPPIVGRRDERGKARSRPAGESLVQRGDQGRRRDSSRQLIANPIRLDNAAIQWIGDGVTAGNKFEIGPGPFELARQMCEERVLVA
jgi:hypothetical protein